MAYVVIPGVRQDHRGFLYFHGIYPNGKLIQIPALGVEALRALEAAPTIPIVEPRAATAARRVQKPQELT